jgi:hypothetical protein
MNSQSLPGRPKRAAAVVALPYWVAEFAQIRWAVLAMVGALGVGAAVVLASQWQRRAAADELRQARQARDAAYARFTQAETEKQEIRRYQPQFVALRRRGLIGEGNRLDWVEAIRQVQEQGRMLPLSYEIDPQQPFTLAAPLATGDYQLRGSRMSLHMELLHEMDLFNFLAELRQRAFFAVQDCSLKRLAGAVNVSAAATLSADCTLNWLVLAPAAAAPADGKSQAGGRP